MIQKLEFLNRKSFNNYTSNNEIFKSKNLIFGYNGRGKSSLALGIVDQIEQNHEANTYRLLNRSYLEENVMLEGNNGLKGVRAIFDKTNVGIVKEVKQLEADIEDTSAIEEAISDINNKIKGKIDKIHNSKKGILQISRKPSTFSLKKILTLYNEDLKEALKVENNIERVKNYDGTDNTFEKELEKLQNLEIPKISFNFPSEDELEYLQTIVDKNYEDIDIPANKILEWINEGVRIHNEEDSCLFCGNSYSLEEVKDKLEIFKKNKINNDIEFLKDIHDRINEIIENSKKLFYKKHEYEIIDKEEIITSLNFEQITKQSKNISLLLDDISENISIDLETIAQFIKEIIEIKDELNNAKLNISKDLSEKNNKFNKLVKGSIAYNILYDDQITDYKSDLEEKEENLLILKERNIKIHKEIDKRNKKASGFEDFKIYLNEVLEALELQFELSSNGDEQGTYYLQHKGEGINLNLSDVSEGEKNLFSLLYFYHELYRDKEQNKSSFVKIS